jgi:predicted enzyme related to lactoylglutathione lyase
MRDAISWFELPATNLERAIAFYDAVLRTKLGEITRADDRRYAMFPADDGVSGALVQGEGYVPSREGALVFLTAGDSLGSVVPGVEPAGGRVLLAHMDMGDWVPPRSSWTRRETGWPCTRRAADQGCQHVSHAPPSRPLSPASRFG